MSEVTGPMMMLEPVPSTFLSASGVLARMCMRNCRAMIDRTIANRVRLDYPHASAMRISHQTIYMWLAEDHRTGGSWSRYLRHHRRRRKRYGSGRVLRASEDECLWQTDRHRHRRGRIGDWEEDLVVGRGQSGFVATHVDRRSRFLLAAKVSRRTAAEVTAVTRKILQPLPRQVRRTLTVDNGSESTASRSLQRTLGLQITLPPLCGVRARGPMKTSTGCCAIISLNRRTSP